MQVKHVPEPGNEPRIYSHIMSHSRTLGLAEVASMVILSPTFSPSVAMVTISGEGDSLWDDSLEMPLETPLEMPLETVDWLGTGDLDIGTGMLKVVIIG